MIETNGCRAAAHNLAVAASGSWRSEAWGLVGYDQVEHREDIVGIVERSINMDVHFASGQKANPIDPSICFVDRLDVIP